MTQLPDSEQPDTGAEAEFETPWPSSSVVVDSTVVPTRSRADRRIAAIVVSVVVVAAGAVTGAKLFSSDHSTTDAAPAVTVSSTTVSSAARPSALGSGLDVAKVVSIISPTVVKVSVDINGADGSGEGVGTGLILSSDGDIVTNAHVVLDATAVRVLLPGNTEPIKAEVVGTDAGNDLALLRVKATGLPVAHFAASDSARVGDQVVAMGFALDLPGEASVTSGIISALSRTMLTQNGALNGLLQTDAAISSGNSGGPLLNAAGQVIGLNTAVARSSAVNTASNIGFAISSKEIQKIVQQLRVSKGGARAEGYLGVGVDDRVDGGRGAIVSRVQPGSPAEKLGLQEGDVVRKVNGDVIDGQAGLIAAIRDLSPGDTVTLEYARNGKTFTGSVTLDARPQN
jgi:putative serine protease PepD